MTSNLERMLGGPGFGELLDLRDWLEKALHAKGARMNGGGVGLGMADLDITLEGKRYNVSIRPLDD